MKPHFPSKLFNSETLVTWKGIITTYDLVNSYALLGDVISLANEKETKAYRKVNK